MKPGGIRPIRKIKYGDVDAKIKMGGEMGIGVSDESRILNANERESNKQRNKSRQRNDMKS